MKWFMMSWDIAMCFVVCIVILRISFIAICALWDVLQRHKSPDLQQPSGDRSTWPPVSVVVPMFNESMVIQETLRTILNSDYPNFELLVVDDGSTDGCGVLVQEMLQKTAHIRLLTQTSNQGKPAALNRAFREAKHPLIFTVDADTRLGPNTLQQVAAGLSKPEVSAVACNLTLFNLENWLTRWQALEYVAALSLDRRAQHRWGTITTVPGAASGWKREVVLEQGGFCSDTLTEDADMSIALLRSGHQIHYLPDARARTLAPVTLRSLFHQRRRWIFGNLQCIWKHREVIWTRTPWKLKIVGLPNFWFSHLMSFGLFALTVAYLPRATQWLEPRPLLGLILSILLADLCVCALAIWIDRGDVRLLFDAPLQRLGLPTFLFTTFGSVCVSKLRRTPVTWNLIRRPKIHGDGDP